MMNYLTQLVECESKINEWLKEEERQHSVPIYTSVDIRDSGVKATIVDTNIYPAGFNNIHPNDHPKVSTLFSEFIQKRQPNTQQILIIAEEHTRNKWYILHLQTLEKLLRNAGYTVLSATFLDPQVDNICKEKHTVILESADGTPFEMHCVHAILDEIEFGTRIIDLIIYNNDLSSGLPKRFRELKIPAHPSPKVGWYARRKSTHFTHFTHLMKHVCHENDLDPWYYTAQFSTIDTVSINNNEDRQKIYKEAQILFEKIKIEAQKHQTTDTLSLFLKSDRGTYGMGVISIQSPQEIIEFNRKIRNNLSKGKSAQNIQHFLLQEGVPTRHLIHSKTAEPCLYLINNQAGGLFFRVNDQKNSIENLNSQGMSFYSASLTQENELTLIEKKAYTLLARIATLATAYEIETL